MNDLTDTLITFVVSFLLSAGISFAITTKYWKNQAIKHGAAEYRLVTSNSTDVIFVWKE